MLGYAGDWNAAPGERVEFKVSCEGVPDYSARIVRVVCADPDPRSPGYRVDPVAEVGGARIEGRFQPIHPGSFVRLDDSSEFGNLGNFSMAALIWPTLPGHRRQAIMGRWNDDRARGFLLELDEIGALAVRLGSGGVHVLSTGTPLLDRRWYVACASFDVEAGRVRLDQRPLRDFPGSPGSASIETELQVDPAATDAPFLIAAHACDGEPGATGFFNGKIERPTVFAAVVDEEEASTCLLVARPCEEAPEPFASWDFSRQMTTERIEDVSPRAIHGRTVNMPTRAMVGHNWDSSTLDWRSAPWQYGAIHFHADDTYDCGWRTDFTWTVPPDARSGFYAAILESEAGDEEFIPFFVRPRPRSPTAKVALIASTATYVAYTNTHVKVDTVGSEVMAESVAQLSQQDLYLLEHRELGHSTYDYHADGSGVCYSSRLRPMLTMRPAPYTFNYVNDTHLLSWLDHVGQPYDVITDEDVHRGGVDVLSDYPVIITLSHPEYASTRMWDAFDAFQQNGGRHLYLGGNGFYWRIAFHDDYPGILECRKDATGVRAWEGEPGEGHMLLSGEPGGLWRTDGRAPQRLVGVGYSSTMFARCTYYRRTAASYEPRYRFIFEGIHPDEVIGDFGLRGGGAAGLEIDRWDPDLGSPPNSVVLASSENVGIDGILSCEEYPIATRATDGLQHGFVRADMVFFETPNDGAVFSVGSIAWLTSLSHNNFDNNVARVTGNVLRRFLDPRAFS